MTQTCVIADIHGRLDLLRDIASQVPDGAKVICLGDYVDRGPESAGVLEFLRAKQAEGWVCLKGNHEDMMVSAVRDGQGVDMWVMNGGAATISSYAPHEDIMSDVDWVDGLPDQHEDEHRVYVHAMASDVVGAARIWGRYPSGARAYFRKHVVHGHTPGKVPEFVADRTNLDTGACWTGMLSMGIFNDDEPGGPIAIRVAKGATGG